MELLLSPIEPIQWRASRPVGLEVKLLTLNLLPQSGAYVWQSLPRSASDCHGCGKGAATRGSRRNYFFASNQPFQPTGITIIRILFGSDELEDSRQ